MSYKKISELPVATRMPNDDELVLPVYFDNASAAYRQISIRQIIDKIKDEVMQGGEIEIILTGNGIKFKKLTHNN